MARLVKVCKSNEDGKRVESNQITLAIDDGLTMVMEIPRNLLTPNEQCCLDSCDNFLERYKNLNVDELAVSFMVTQNEVLAFLSQTVPCVGCRQSVEKLYNHVMKTNQPALEPLVITKSGVLTIDASFLKDPCVLHTFLYCQGSKLNEILERIPKCRRNRRCLLHSLETHKSRTPIGCWVDIWDALSQKCREEVLTIRSDTLLDALENHLRKNRFCSECKRKVLKAFGILTGDIESDKVKGYCASLYKGLKPCPLHKHVHLPNDVDYLNVLLEKAEHELSGMRRERHAKSMDSAQEEVLTCLAVYMWERLHHLWQKLRTEEQTWQMLFYLGINTLRRSFEVSVEEKQGVSRLEQVVEEIFEEEKVKEVRREQKRQKKRARRKEKCKFGENDSHSLDNILPEIACTDADHLNGGSLCDAADQADCVHNGFADDEVNGTHCVCDDEPLSNGYDAATESVECWSMAHSCTACLDSDEQGRNGFCDDQGAGEFPGFNHAVPVGDEEKQLLLSMGWVSEEPCQGDDIVETENEKISKEEIQQFKANRHLTNQRQKLREKLREQFNSLSVSAAQSSG